MNDVPCLSPQLLLILKDERVLSKVGQKNKINAKLVGCWRKLSLLDYTYEIQSNKRINYCLIVQSKNKYL